MPVSADTQAGLGSIAVLLHELLWWGGLLGVVALLACCVLAGRRPAPAADDAPPLALTDADQWPLRVAVALAAAAAVHLVMAPAHLAEGPAHVAFFALAGAAQVALAAAMLLAPASRATLTAVLVSGVGLTTLWALSRTVGVAGEVEPVGSWDLCVVLWQSYTVVVAARHLADPGVTRHLVGVRAWSLQTSTLAAVTGLVLVVLPWSGGHA